MNKYQALHSFWSGFGLSAYDETSVPDNADLPYITYETSGDDFDHQLFLTASLWYRGSSWANAQMMEMHISNIIGAGGKLVHYDDGAFWVRRGHPWAQRMSEPSNDAIRRIVLNVIIEFID